MTQESTEKKTLRPKSLCEKCRTSLIHGAKYKRHDPWMALEVTSLLTLINLALKDNKFLIKYGNDAMAINRISCLGCFLPDKLKEIIKIAKETRDLAKIKAFGELP